MIEISRILLLQNSADTAAYEGARCAMVPGANTTEAVSSAMRLLQAAGLKKCEIKVAPDVITEETELILVNVEVPVAPNAGSLRFGSCQTRSLAKLLSFANALLQ